MKIKILIYSLSLDGPKCGTVGGAFATEREALEHLVHNYTAGVTQEVLDALLKAGYYDDLEELLLDQGDGLTSWDVCEHTLEVEIPILGLLARALQRVLACPDLNEDSLAPETVAAIAVAQAMLRDATLAQSAATSPSP